MTEQEKVSYLYKIIVLALESGNSLVLKFFDFHSEKMIDKKIEVLTRLANGETISQIPEFYDILELYPKDTSHKTILWD